jgi:hypothetical protein
MFAEKASEFKSELDEYLDSVKDDPNLQGQLY